MIHTPYLKKSKLNKKKNKGTGIRLRMAVLFAFFLAANVGVAYVAASEDASEANASGSEVSVESEELEEILTEVDDASEIVTFINDNWEGDYSEDPGEDDTYQLKRIMVLTSGAELTETYGASDIIYYGEYSEYVLQFETEADTEYAYYELVEDFGTDNCYIDQIVTADILSDVSGISTYSPLSWGGSFMGFDYLKPEYDYYQIDTEVTVAIIDTGVDTSSSIFDGRIDTLHSFYFQGSDSIETTDDYTDENGHGTHVTGIIVDNTPENVSIMVLKTFDADGNSTNLAIRTALQYAVDNGADVVNMSLGWTGVLWAYSTYLEDVLAEAESKGTIICCAAGNSASDVSTTYPANQENVITVSAVNSKGAFATSYSNYGDTVDFSAPGTSIKSTYLNGGTYTMSGTSMSTPHMVAAVAYIKMIDQSLDLDGVMSVLKTYAVDCGDSGWDKYYGYGYVNLKYYFDNSSLSTRYTDYDEEGNEKETPTASFSASSVTKTYGDDAFTYSVSTNSSGKVLYSSSDTSVATTNRSGYIIIKGAGTCTITAEIQADDTYKSTSATFTLVVNPKSISGMTATLSKTKYTYSGKACKPSVTVEDLKNSNYTVTYENADTPGTATCVITGKGNYTGTIKKTYTIGLSSATIKKVTNKAAGITVTWKKTAGAAKYRVFRKTANGSWKKIADVIGENTLKYTDTTATANTVYKYRIKAINGSQKSSFSSALSIRRVESPVYDVTNASLGVQITWSSVNGATKYKVYRKVGNGSFKLVSTTKNTVYLDKKVSVGKLYTYKVKAVKGSYSSGFGEKISIYRIKPTKLSSASNSSSGKISLKWTKIAKATGYEIEYSTSSSFANAKTVTVKGRNKLTTVISDLKKSKTYYIRVRSYKKYKGEMYYSVWSSILSVKVRK